MELSIRPGINNNTNTNNSKKTKENIYNAIIYSVKPYASSLWVLWAKVSQHVATNSQVELQTWPLSTPVGCYRLNIHPSPYIITQPWGWYSFTVPRRVEGWVDLDTALNVQPMPNAAYCSDFRETQNCLQCGFDPGTSWAACKRATTRPLQPAMPVSNGRLSVH